MISEELIKELAHRKAWRYKHSTEPQHSDTYTFNDMCLIDLCRAIEAECRVPDGYVLVPMEPKDAQLDTAVAFALNVFLHEGYNWSDYMRDLYQRMLSAAPEPVQQEAKPVAYRHMMDDGWEYFDAPTGEDCKGCHALYLAPPTESAIRADERERALEDAAKWFQGRDMDYTGSAVAVLIRAMKGGK